MGVLLAVVFHFSTDRIVDRSDRQIKKQDKFYVLSILPVSQLPKRHLCQHSLSTHNSTAQQPPMCPDKGSCCLKPGLRYFNHTDHIAMSVHHTTHPAWETGTWTTGTGLQQPKLPAASSGHQFRAPHSKYHHASTPVSGQQSSGPCSLSISITKLVPKT